MPKFGGAIARDSSLNACRRNNKMEKRRRNRDYARKFAGVRCVVVIYFFALCVMRYASCVLLLCCRLVCLCTSLEWFQNCRLAGPVIRPLRD